MVHGDIDERDLTSFGAFIEQMVGAGVLTPDEELEAEIRRVGHLPEKIDKGPAEGVQPGEENEDEQESKSTYKITHILDKYQMGKITRKIAEKVLRSLGCDEEETKFYLNEAEIARKQNEQDDAKAEDEKDQKEAEEAKKSLGRLDKFFKKG